MAAYIKLLCSVARNRKFVKAGPAPSWLWACSLMYCQEGETDGFIPEESLPYLGVKNAAQLADHLVKAGLWEKADGGWRVHDYLVYNKSASEIADLKTRRADGGNLGGRPRKNLPHTAKVSHAKPSTKPSQKTFAVDVDVSAAEAVVVEGVSGEPAFDGQRAFAQLTAAYPRNRIVTGQRVQVAFLDALGPDVRCWPATFAQMLANLENHLASHEWRVKGLIPALDNWLEKGLWQRRLSGDPPAGEQLTDKTQRTLSGAATFAKGA